ncbi:MAG: hypothetical protein IKN78_07115, partial [Bacteroidales bacterium]|nr:hypothetical protein [Bacteroidales bacterium]
MFQGEYVQLLQTRSNYIRPVRNFGDEAEAFWVEPYLADGTKSGSMKVSPKVTTTYDAVVVFGKDTLPLTGTVVVHEKYDTDTLYEVVCQSTEPYNSKKSSLFTNLDISQVTHGYDTLSRTTHTIHGCDSTVALLLKVVGDCEHFYRDSICPIVTQHDFLPFDTTFLPGTISGVYEHHGKKTVEGTEIDTVAFYDLTIMPEYHLTDDLHLCLEEETTVIPYTENEHVTITVTHGKITLVSDDARVVIDSTDKVNGNFVLRMTTEFGCDSLVTLHIDTSSVQFDTVRRADVFIANTPECTDRVIGAQNSTSFYYPLSNYYNYSCSQQIFTSAELGEAGPINTISFNYASATPTTSKTDVKIYLAHTTKNSFNDSYDWVSPSSMTLVYDGELNCANQGWNEFVLNQTFDYNGTDNLLVMVLDESDAWDGWYSFYSTSTPGGNYKTLYYYSSGSYWVPGSYGDRGSYRSDIRFSGCTEDNVFYTTEVAGNSFTVSEPGTYTKTETVTGSNGCDSTTTTILVVRPPYEDEICDSTFHAETQTWTDNVEPYCWQHLGASYCIAGKTLDEHGLYEFFGKDTIGGVEMDTTLYLKLTINPTYRDTDSIGTCLYEEPTELPYNVNGGTLTLSLTETKVTVTNSVIGVVVDTIDAAKGDFALKMQTDKGCDSVLILHVNHPIVKREAYYAEVFYEGTPFTHTLATHDFAVTESGVMIFTDTLSGSNGCDSITKRILIVEEPHYDTICDRIYDEATLMWKDNVTPYCWVYNGKNNCIEGKSENANGFYEFKGTKDIDGVLVDTTSYLKLTVIPTKENEDNIDTCLYENAVSFAYEKDSRITITISTSEGVMVTSSETDVIEVLTVNASTGDFILKTTAANGCDSIVRLNVRYNFVQRDTLTDQVHIAQVVANGNKWTVGGYTFENITEPGVYTLRDTLPGSNGCDSIVVLKVDVLPCPELSIVCPPDHYDTLAFGDCVMEIYPEKIGTPTVTVDPADWPFEVSNDIPADNLYQEGETIITWVATDPVCGYSASCEQKVVVVFPKCPDAVDCEGNVYHGVRIDCDCWTQTNLVSNCYGDANECVETGNCDDPIPCVFEYESGFHPNV